MNSKESSRRKALIIQTAFLGDAILTLPLAAALKRAGYEVVVLSRPGISEVFESSSDVKKVISYDKKKSGEGDKSFIGILRILKKEKYSIAFLPQRSFRSGLLAFLSGIKVRAGFKRGGARIFLNRKYPFNWDEHEVMRILSLAKASEIDDPPVEFNLRADEALREKYRELLGDSPLVGIAPESEWRTKRWPKERFEKLADMLPESVTPVFLGVSPRQEELNRGVSLEGKTSIKELIGVVSLLKALVSNDSGIIHIAAALGVRTIAVFGPTVPDMGFAPFGDEHIIIQNKDLSCRPCGLHGPRSCPKKHFRCMLDIPPEEVYAELRKIVE